MSLMSKALMVFVIYTLFQFIRAMLNGFKVRQYNNDDKLVLATLDLITLYLLLDVILVKLNNHLFNSKAILSATNYLGELFKINCMLMSFALVTSTILVINKYDYSDTIKKNYESNMIKLRELRFQGFLSLSFTTIASWILCFFSRTSKGGVNKYENLLIVILLLVCFSKYFYGKSNNLIMKFVKSKNNE